MQSQIVPFSYNNTQIRVIADSSGEPWWVAKDVCEVLGYEDTKVALRKLDDDEKLRSKIYSSGQTREMSIINESGLYTLILRSNKPEAKKFKKWVTSEVLPSIRKTGSYSTNQASKPTFNEHLVRKLESKNEEIIKLKDELIEQLKMVNSLLMGKETKEELCDVYVPAKRAFREDEDRVLLQMKKEGYNYAEIAGRLGRSYGSVQNRYRKLKKEGIV